MSKVRVWDLPTRLFHWALVLCFAGLIITGEVAGDAMAWHFRLGYALLTLVLFRVVWGFVGGYWSRFGNFVVGPKMLLAYLRNSETAPKPLGHNPLGALSVLALLAFGLLQAGAGLMSDDEILASGPLVAKVPAAWVGWATFFHTEIGKVALIALVGLHVAAIAWYRFKKNENLIRPMVLGDKEVNGSQPASRDDIYSRLGALVVLVACAGAVAALLRWAQ